MKKLIFSALSIAMAVIGFTSCDLTPDDLMTGDVKTGGILLPTASIPYKLGGTPSFDVSIAIPKGPGIVSIEVYKSYTGKTELLDQTINAGSANITEDAEVKTTYNYTQLSSGLDLPADETLLTIGDAWTLRYVSVMEDGRKVEVSKKTTITVANKYAGYYQCEGVFTHPTAGPRPINEKKFMTPVDANSSWGPAGDLGASGYFAKFTVDPVTNAVTCSKWDNYEIVNLPGEESTYDPETGVFVLNYGYIGGGGLMREIRETWTPSE
jgi:hypothetical protein